MVMDDLALELVTKSATLDLNAAASDLVFPLVCAKRSDLRMPAARFSTSRFAAGMSAILGCTLDFLLPLVLDRVFVSGLRLLFVSFGTACLDLGS